MELSAPVLFHRKALVADSGGTGRQRGGLGQEIRFEYRGSRPGHITMMSARIQSPPRGFFGGGDGLPTAYHVNGKLADPNGRTELAFGDIVTIRFPGGGGYGPPMDRAAALVATDVANGLVSETAADRYYGAAWRGVVRVEESA
jgi:N-methylhydantoinase B